MKAASYPSTHDGTTARRRVLLYVHRLAPANPTGVHRYVNELSNAIGRNQSDLDVTLCSGRAGEAILADAYQLPLRHPRLPRRPLHLTWMLTHWPAIERLTAPTDLFHVLLPICPIPSKASQVITVHDLLPVHHPDWYSRFNRVAFRAAIDFHLPRAAAIIVPSQAVADDLVATIAIDPGRITVIPEGVGATFHAPVEPEAAARTLSALGLGDRPYLVTVGALSPRKNLGVLFDALARLEREDGDAPLIVVVGADDVGADQTRAAAEASAAGHLVRFAGRLGDEQLPHVLASALALVHPSLFEGFGLTPLEAMASGTPVIAADSGALPEVVGNAGILVEPSDVAAWAEAVRAVRGDDRLRSRLVNDGRRRATEMTWDLAATRTLAVYRRVLDAR